MGHLLTTTGLRWRFIDRTFRPHDPMLDKLDEALKRRTFPPNSGAWWTLKFREIPVKDRYNVTIHRRLEKRNVGSILTKEQDEHGAPLHNVIALPSMPYITSDTGHHTISIFRIYDARSAHSLFLRQRAAPIVFSNPPIVTYMSNRYWYSFPYPQINSFYLLLRSSYENYSFLAPVIFQRFRSWIPRF